MSLPDGPKSPKIWQMFQWITTPFSFMQGCSDRYGDRFTHRLKNFKCLFRRLVVTGIGDAFAASGVRAMPYLCHNRHGLCLGAPADGEGTGDGEAFDSHVKRWKVVGSHFNVWRFLNLALARRNQLWLVMGCFDKTGSAAGRISAGRRRGAGTLKL